MIRPILKVVAAVLTVGLGLWSGRVTAQDEDRTHTLNAYWAEPPPTLDGDASDACWRDAETASDFTLLNTDQAPAESTEVRVCYDATNLYVLYVLHDSDIEQLKYGTPEDMRDMVDVGKDAAELFLDPGATRKHLYQLMASPLGARFDLSTFRGKAWNPDWLVVPGIHKDRWVLEIAIPFREMAISAPIDKTDWQFQGTPMPGDEWGINFCRDQGRLREWSNWKRTGQSFHTPSKFGTLVFRGRRESMALPRVTWRDREVLYYGSGEVALTVDRAVAADFVLTRNGEVVERKHVTGDDVLRFPYHILESGQWAVDVMVGENGTPCFAGRTVFTLRPLNDMLQAIRDKTAEAYQRLDTLEHPAVAELRNRLDEVTRAAAGPIERMAHPAALSREDWQAIEAQVPALRALWNGAAFDVHIVRFYPEGEADRPFVLSSATPDERIHRRELLPELRQGPVRLAQAGGEWESFQVLVIPFWQTLDKVSATFSDLSGPAGHVVSATNIVWSRVDYVEMESHDPDDPESWPFEPDILWPGEPFTAEAGAIQPIFADVFLPRDTPPGTYTGRVTVTAGNFSRALPIEVRSYGFNIPARNTLQQDPWYAPASFWAGYHGKPYGQGPFNLELYEQHLKVLSRYRLPCFPLDTYAMWRHMTIYREADGRLTFDFSEWARIVKLGLRYGASSFGASFGCNMGAHRPFWAPSHVGAKIVDRATGEATPAQELVKPWLDAKPGWEEHPYYLEYMRQFVEFMRCNGVLQLHDFELFDEPKSVPDVRALVNHHRMLRKIVPELRFKNYGTYPEFSAGGQYLVGWSDTWAPNLSGLDQNMVEAIHARRERWGEEFWFYTCGESRRPDGSRGPYMVYDDSYLAPRIHGWIAWDVRADGFLIFMLNQVPKSNQPGKEKKAIFPEVPWKSGPWERGLGTFVYPLPDGGMLPGMRLANYRDGLEDFEYFHRLHDRMRYLAPDAYPENRALFERAEAELNIEEDIVQSYRWSHWTRDRALLDAKRDRLAALIREIETIAGLQVPAPGEE